MSPEAAHDRAAKRVANQKLLEGFGVLRGSHDGSNNGRVKKIEPPIDLDADDEGLSVFFQTEVCRRQVLTRVYGNNEPSKLMTYNRHKKTYKDDI